MSIPLLRASLKSLYLNCNLKQRSATEAVKKNVRQFDSLIPEVQAEEINKYRGQVATEISGQLSLLKKRIEDEKKESKGKIGAFKYPNSADKATSLLGEIQIGNAFRYLASNPTPENILKSIREGFDLGRVDYSFTLAENAIDRMKRIDGRLNQDDAALEAAIENTINSFDRSDRLKELEAGLAGFPALEKISDDFENQIAGGMSQAVIPELVNDLTDSERLEMLSSIDAGNFSLVDRVSLRLRITEAVNNGKA